MANCNYLIKGVSCGLEIEKPEKEKCYVHKCMINKEIIVDSGKFINFSRKHKDIFFTPDPESELMIIGFDFDLENLAGVAIKLRSHRKYLFYNINFLKEASFDANRFSSSSFINCIFDSTTKFKGVFKEYLDNQKCDHFFKNVIFRDNADFSNVKFNNFEFQDVDFSKCLFAGSEFNNCKFTRVEWCKKGRFFVRKGVLYDEIKRDKEKDYKISFSDLEKLYRNLKSNAIKYENREMEGEFHYSENEMIMRNTGWFSRAGLAKRLYYIGSRFGERPSKALFNIFFIVAIFSIMYWLTGLNIIENATIKLKFWEYPIAHALSPLTFYKWQITSPTSLFGLFLYIFEGALLATQIGLFVNALRRKLQR